MVETRVASSHDYDWIIAVVDDWWGRSVVDVLPRLFLDHFAGSSRVAEDETGLVGFLVGFASPTQPKRAYIHFVGVRPDQRRLGLARRLYAEFVELTQAWGCQELRAITSPTNHGSIRFHKRLGFTAETVPDYNGPGRSMVVFQQQLDAAASNLG